MDQLPPDVPIDPPKSIYHRAGSVAVGVLVVAFALNLGTGSLRVGDPSIARFFSILIAGLFLLAIVAGIVALCGIPKYGTKKLLWKGLVGILVPLLLVVLAVPAFLKVREASLVKAVALEARQINAESPKMVDEATRMEGAVVGPDTTVTVNLTLVALNAADVDREAWKTKVVPLVRSNIEKTPLITFVRGGATIIYRYSGKDHVLVDTIAFRPEDYPAAKK